MSTETTQTLSLDAALTISQRNGEPQWMQDLRQRAWEMYESTAMPSLKDEEWRRTEPQLRKINFDMLQVPQPNGSVPLPAEWQPAADALLTRAGLLISHVSTPAHRSVAQELAAQGVILTDMNTAVREHGDLVRTAFMTEAVKPDFSKFAALNGALWSGGTFLYVPDNVKVELPLQSSTWLDQPGLGVFPHTLVVVGRNSEVTLIEETGSRTADGTLNVPVVELILHDGAKLSYITLQELDDSVKQIGMHRAVLHRDSTLT
ncbi:MAG: sufD, partial [Chloroflexi bacterium]|nr:sufD [Chloroflexota bacterium]